MHGNIWEWCLDDWHDNYEGAPDDGSAWFDDNINLAEKQSRTVVRGGSWADHPKDCRSADRDDNYSAKRNQINHYNGFRVVCVMPSKIEFIDN